MNKKDFFFFLFGSSKFIDLVNVMVVAVLYYLFFDVMNIDAMGELSTAPAWKQFNVWHYKEDE